MWHQENCSFKKEIILFVTLSTVLPSWWYCTNVNHIFHELNKTARDNSVWEEELTCSAGKTPTVISLSKNYLMLLIDMSYIWILYFAMLFGFFFNFLNCNNFFLKIYFNNNFIHFHDSGKMCINKIPFINKIKCN